MPYKKLLLSAFLLLSAQLSAQKLTTRFEESKGLQTPTYQEGMDWWQQLDQAYDKIQLLEMGPTDSGYPLHLLIYSNEPLSLDQLKESNKTIVLINNAIHPGEPDGVDASMMLMRDMLASKKWQKELADVVVAVIPFYNVGGALNRNSTTRANQQGPESYGFRGNAQNLDLNRDFIKNDSRNARSFTEIFHALDPDLYVEPHVSNGADYQYTLTLLSTQHNKLGGPLGDYLQHELEPALFKGMEAAGWPLTPYVNVFGVVPDSGFVQFMDSPRYSSGYAALHNTIGFITETHMLKPYKQRVEATYDFLKEILEVAAQEGQKIQALKEEQAREVKAKKEFVLKWEVDKSQPSTIPFKGYEASLAPSKVSGQERLFYDRSKPFEKEIKFFNQYKPSLLVEAPAYYAIPRGWWKVTELLKANKVQMEELEKDTVLEAEVYFIRDYKTFDKPYEGHYLHHDVEVDKKRQQIALRKGDYLIPVNQQSNRYIVETLEPQGPDSFFAWNFFDAILQQKEHFSAYVFEDIAANLLEENPDLKKKLEAQKKADAAFAADGQAQLEFIYQNSPHYEKAHLRYPVFRIKQ